MKKYLVIASILFILASVSLLNNKDTGIEKQVDNSIAVNSSYPLLFSDDNKEILFEEWADKQNFFATKEDAQKALPYPAKLPTEYTGKLQGIYITKEKDPVERQIHVYYDGGIKGIQLHIHQEKDKPNFEENIKQVLENMNTGIAKNDKPPRIVTFSGYTAWAIEPGYNIIDSQKYPRPGVLLWWDNGVLYDLYGTPGENGTSVNELIQIASSVKPI